jgi:signal transduction histidine kinase
MDFGTIQLFKVLVIFPPYFLPFLFFVFRKRIWQSLFLLGISMQYLPIGNGLGMYVGVNWFAANPIPAANIVNLAVIAITLPPLLFLLRRLYDNLYLMQTNIWRFIWLLPCSYFAIIIVAGEPFDSAAFTGAGFVLLRIFMYGAIMLTCHLLESALRQATENISLKASAAMVESRIGQQEEQFNMIAENEDKVMKARHDLRHHLSVLRGLWDGGKFGELGEYLSEYTAAVGEETGAAFCPNTRVNALLGYYAAKARELGVELSVNADIPKDSGISDTDLCVVLGNCFENAIAACADVPEGRRFIRLKCAPVSGSLMVLLDNSFNGLAPAKQGTRFLSAKHEGAGIGLASVMSVAEKYGGMADFTTEGGEFRSAVELKMYGEPHCQDNYPWKSH